MTGPEASPPLTKKPRGALYWVLVIGVPIVLCCGSGLAFALWKGADFLRIAAVPASERGAAFSEALSKMVPAETAAVDTFVAHMDAGRDAEAWAMTSAGWQSATSRKQSDDLLVLIRSVMGPCASKRLLNVNTRNVVGGVSTVDLVYDATFANGPGVLRVTTSVGAAGPAIHAFRVESPLFMQAAQRGVSAPDAETPDIAVPDTPADEPGTPK